MSDIVPQLMPLLYAGIVLFIVEALATSIFKEKRAISFVQKAGFSVLTILFFFALFHFANYIFEEIRLEETGILLNIAYVTVLCLIFCRVKIYWALLFSICVMLFLEAIGFLIGTVINLAMPYFDISEADYVLDTLIHIGVHLFLYVLIKVIIQLIDKASDKKQKKIGIVLLAFTVITLSIMLFSTFYDFPAGFGMAFFIMAGIAVFLLIDTAIKHKENERLISIYDAQLAMQKEYVAQITQKQQQVLQLSHDFKQHIHTLQSLSNSGNYTEMAETLQKLSQEQTNGIGIISTGNATLDALLSIKHEIAQCENIQCDWNVEIPPQIPIQELDVCIVLGNAIDNAIEACRDAAVVNPYIKLEMHIDNDWLLCEIINPIIRPPKVEKGIYKTTKSNADEHGIGIQSMIRRCEDMGGNFEVFFNETEFTVRFMLPFDVIGA